MRLLKKLLFSNGAISSRLVATEPHERNTNVSKFTSHWLAFMLGLNIGFAIMFGCMLLNREQSANDLIQAGFTITDPEGHAVAKFD